MEWDGGLEVEPTAEKGVKRGRASGKIGDGCGARVAGSGRESQEEENGDDGRRERKGQGPDGHGAGTPDEERVDEAKQRRQKSDRSRLCCSSHGSKIVKR